MKLFVTGATGFIGSHFVKLAMDAGHNVLALRHSPSSQTRIVLAAQPQWLEKSMERVSADDLAGVEAVVHLASHSPNFPYDSLEKCLHWNLMVPLKLFREAMKVNIDRFIVVGSCFEYGRAGERYDYIPPDAPLEPTQSYPASKAIASIAFSQLAIENMLRLSIHRIFQAYGVGEAETRFWPSLCRAALAGEDFQLTAGEQIRDFVPVEKVAEQLIAASTRVDIRPGEPVIENVGTGKPQTLREFAEDWWKRCGASGKLHFGEVSYRGGEVMRYVPLVKGSTIKDG